MVSACNRCGREFERTPEFWYPHASRSDGLLGTCRTCAAADARERYARNRAARLKQQESAVVRACNRCGREFPRTPAFWPRHANGKEGLEARCKECQAASWQEKYARVRESYLARQKEYRKRTRQPGSRHGEYLARREQLIAYTREYRRRHPDQARITQHLYGRGRTPIPGVFTKEDIDRKLETQCGLCFYCKRDLRMSKFQIDHYIPVARGGTNDPSNLVLACPPCNRAKSAKLPGDFQPKPPQ